MFKFDRDVQAEHFKNHVASFTDLGKVKILDFKRPDSNEYRIRFLFEEDYYRLHISGDLGELTASNYCNMCWEKFYTDFTADPDYFASKVDCMSRARYFYDEEAAREDILKRLHERDVQEVDIPYVDFESFIDYVLDDFDDEHGISAFGEEHLGQVFPYPEGFSHGIGRRESDIFKLYLLAFELAYEQI